MSLKASSSIADRKIEKSVRASTHPCLTPFVIANVPDTSPPFLTLTIIPVCRLSIMVVNFSRHTYFPRQLLQSSTPTVSNAFVKSTKAIYKDLVGWSKKRYTSVITTFCWSPFVYMVTMLVSFQACCTWPSSNVLMVHRCSLLDNLAPRISILLLEFRSTGCFSIF